MAPHPCTFGDRGQINAVQDRLVLSTGNYPIGSLQLNNYKATSLSLFDFANWPSNLSAKFDPYYSFLSYYINELIDNHHLNLQIDRVENKAIYHIISFVNMLQLCGAQDWKYYIELLLHSYCM